MPGCGFDPLSGQVLEAADQCFFLSLFFLPLGEEKKKNPGKRPHPMAATVKYTWPRGGQTLVRVEFLSL